jgi:hypothetical protein
LGIRHSDSQRFFDLKTQYYYQIFTSFLEFSISIKYLHRNFHFVFLPTSQTDKFLTVSFVLTVTPTREEVNKNSSDEENLDTIGSTRVCPVVFLLIKEKQDANCSKYVVMVMNLLIFFCFTCLNH